MTNFNEYIKTLNDKERQVVANAIMALCKDKDHLLLDDAVNDAFWTCLLGPEESKE